MKNYPDKIILEEGFLDLEVRHLTAEKIQSDRALKPFRNAVATFFDYNQTEPDIKQPKYRLVLEKIKD